ncbi:hypothetical protein [Saccharothrix sp.]|uniref:hypothetical protein n=1 Tax=Saccharothrix sp. TaxID=1873460 RepID=UPI0028119E62|nr:hypothetical protein [Saccharothrix sp.]
MNDEISRRLREAAEAHQPDRGRMLARVQRGLAGATVRRTPGIARSWPRVAFAGVAAAGALAIAGVAVAAIVVAPERPDTAISATTPAPSTTTRTTEAPTPPQQGQPEHTASRSSDPTPTSPENRASDGPLAAEGSIDPHSHAYWSQSRLILKTTQPLTALTVELRISQTGGVQTTGQWQTGPADDFTITVQEVDGTLVYRWVLKPDRTVPAGEHAFAAQYNHQSGPRDAHADRYEAQSGTHTVRGTFTAVK